MPKKGFTEDQITYALRQAEAGTPVLEVCRKLGVTEQTFYRWKKRFAGLSTSSRGAGQHEHPLGGILRSGM